VTTRKAPSAEKDPRSSRRPTHRPAARPKPEPSAPDQAAGIEVRGGETQPLSDAEVAAATSHATHRTVGTIDQFSRRSDADVLPGAFGRIETGEYAGQVGVFDQVVSTDPDGCPETVLVTLRNSGVGTVVDYADLTPVAFGGR
jgi:hypothetical protein